MKRVVITGMGIVSPIGNSLDAVLESLYSGYSGIVKMDSWKAIEGLNTSIAGLAKDYDKKRINRKDRRTMGEMSVMASISALDAIDQAGIEKGIIASPDTGIAMGSTTGSGQIIEEVFSDYSATGGITRLEGTAFMKIMSHTVTANLSSMLKTKGRVISPCCACATSTQSIGEGYEIIKNGHQKVMLCGGADEMHPSTGGVFDVLHATSKNYCESPSKTPRPFDKDRDGLVVSEGAGTIVLEEYEHAKNRGADIIGEIIGYSTCCDGNHMTNPGTEGMSRCMTQALASAGCSISDIDYINAHATATELGDIAEAEAIKTIAGDSVPVSGTKGYTGHTLAACGVMEVIFSLLMMKHDFIAPTLNLETVDPRCDGISHVKEKTDKKLNRIMTSNFAFGGINATLILKKAE